MDFNKFKLDIKKADIYYIPNFLPKEKADLYFEKLVKSIEFVKKEYEGRQTALYSDAKRYKYALNDSKTMDRRFT